MRSVEIEHEDAVESRQRFSKQVAFPRFRIEEHDFAKGGEHPNIGSGVFKDNS